MEDEDDGEDEVRNGTRDKNNKEDHEDLII